MFIPQISGVALNLHHRSCFFSGSGGAVNAETHERVKCGEQETVENLAYHETSKPPNG